MPNICKNCGKQICEGCIIATTIHMENQCHGDCSPTKTDDNCKKCGYPKKVHCKECPEGKCSDCPCPSTKTDESLEDEALEYSVGYDIGGKDYNALSISKREGDKIKGIVLVSGQEADAILWLIEKEKDAAYQKGVEEAQKQVWCREDIDGTMCDCCQNNYDRIEDLESLTKK